MELISVIVPVYKVEEYIKTCVNSIRRQTYHNIEIILIDDGSPDECGVICDQYANLDKRIRVIHKKNGGLSDARNAGMNIANGEYISFIDADDYVSEYYIETLYKILKDNDADMSICGCNIVYDDNGCLVRSESNKTEVCSQEECIRRSLSIHLRQSAWGKLYPVELLRNIRFPITVNNLRIFLPAQLAQ